MIIRRLLWLFVVLSLASPAHAANIFENVTGGLVLQYDPSVRWRAMGDAGTAGFWDPTHAWANPALLGIATGIQYQAASIDPDFLDLQTGRLTLGMDGLGLSTTGLPVSGLGEIEVGALDESARSWSVGISTAHVAAAIARRRGVGPPASTRWFDLAVGYSEKRAEEHFLAFLGETSTTTARDLGILARGGAPVGPTARLDFAYGYADINTNQPKFEYAFRTVRDTRNGIAARFAWHPATFDSRVPTWLRDGTSPLLGVSWAMDFVHRAPYDESFHDWGAELGLANLLFGRIGDLGEEVTWGVGAGLPLGRFAAVRWDYSSRQRTFVPDEHGNAWTVWMDPIAIFGATR